MSMEQNTPTKPWAEDSILCGGVTQHASDTTLCVFNCRTNPLLTRQTHMTCHCHLFVEETSFAHCVFVFVSKGKLYFTYDSLYVQDD